MAEGAKIKTGVLEANSYGENDVGGPIVDQFDSSVVGSKPIAVGSEPIACGSQFVVKVEEREFEMSGSVNYLIEEVIGKVNLVGVSGNSGLDENVVKSKTISDDIKSETMDENNMKSETIGEKDESESSEGEVENTSSSSCSSSSGCSSSEDDTSDNDVETEEVKEKEEKEVKVESKFSEVTEVEEGEIRDADGPDMVDQTHDDDKSDEDEDEDEEEEMVTWSDVDVADEEEDGDGALKGPIKSKNELEVLPSVPPVNATLQPHHQMLPVGVVLSMIGTQVIVEGVEKHSPLNDGSILWITESRSPLGLVDEIFGPVKNPYYVVRYNSESEVPAGVQIGSLISFVPEFVSHVLNNKDVYKKGYDASGANDEEVYDEAEFSDDEKEAEFKRMQKMSKRGMNDQKPVNKNDKRKVKNRAEPWKSSKNSSLPAPTDAGHVPPNQHQHNLSPHLAQVDNANSSTSFTVGQGLIPQLRPTAQTACFNPPSNGVWGNGMPFQQPQGAFFPGGFPAYGMPWLPQNSQAQQYPFQIAMPNMFPQQVDPSQRLLPANLLPGQQSNTLAGSAYSQGPVGQNGYNQLTFGMGLQGQPSQPILNVGQQGINLNGLHNGQKCNVPQPGGIPGNNNEAFQQFNVGASGRGRKPFHRGGGRGGRFSRGRGGNQSR